MRFHHFVQATLFLSQNVAHVKPKAARPCYSTIQTLSWSRPARGAIHWPETAGKNTVSLLIIIMARYGKAGLTQRTIQIDLTFIGFYWYHIYIFIYCIIVYPCLSTESWSVWIENCFANGWTPMATLSKPQVPLYLGATAGLRELHDRDRDEAGESPTHHLETSEVS